MRHMIQHENGGVEAGDDEKLKFEVKGEREGGNDAQGNQFVVVEVINEEIEYDEEEYELDPDQMGEQMVEVDGTETYKLADDDDELVSGFDFDEEDESGIKH